MNRRPLLLGLLASAVPTAVFSQGRPVGPPLLVGVETSLVTSGLAGRLQAALLRDTGIPVKFAPGTSASVLEALERGEVDVSLTNAPELELKLEKQGLAHDRKAVAHGDMLLVGPVTGKGRNATDPAGVLGSRDIAAALAKLAQSQSRFVAPAEGSGAHLAELSLWRAAKVAPAAPWYSKTPAQGDALATAAAQGAYTVVERAVWLDRGRAPLAPVVEGDPLMANPVHAMRSFRVKHPAGKMFVQWVGGSMGHRVAAGARGWGAPK